MSILYLSDKYKAILAISFLLLALCSCSRRHPVPSEEAVQTESAEETEDTPGYKDTLVIVRPDAPETLDPVIVDDMAATRLYHSIIPGLVQVDADGKIVPDLAVSWEKSDDGLVWTFHLRKDLKFADGTPVTVEDWRFTFERARNAPDSVWRFAADEIEKVEGSEDTLVLTLSRERPAFLAGLSLFNMGVQSKAHFDSQGHSYKDGWPLGAGAYYITGMSEESIIMEANPYYYREGYPKTPRVRFEKIPEDNIRLMRLDDAQADVMTDVPYAGAAYTDMMDGISVHAFPSTQCRYLVMNGIANPALSDLQVRRALIMATDFQRLMDVCMNGYGIQSNSYLSPVTPGYDLDLDPYPYDPVKAKELLEKAGYKDRLKINFYLRKGIVLFEEIGMEIQKQWSEAGVTVNIVPLDSEELKARQRDLDLDLVIGTWTEDIPDPSGITEYLLNYENNRGFYTGWKSQEAEELFQLAKYEMDEEKRGKMYDRIQEIVHDEAALPALFCAEELIAGRDKVSGFQLTPYGQFILEEVVVNE